MLFSHYWQNGFASRIWPAGCSLETCFKAKSLLDFDWSVLVYISEACEYKEAQSLHRPRWPLLKLHYWLQTAYCRSCTYNIEILTSALSRKFYEKYGGIDWNFTIKTFQFSEGSLSICQFKSKHNCLGRKRQTNALFMDETRDIEYLMLGLGCCLQTPIKNSGYAPGGMLRGRPPTTSVRSKKNPHIVCFVGSACNCATMQTHKQWTVPNVKRDCANICSRICLICQGD